MKCNICGGAGYVVHPMMSMNGDEYTGEWEQHECEVCGGTGEYEPFDVDVELDKLYPTEQTNEEWLRNLSFNEFARVLYCMIINGERIRPDLAYIKKWLKEKHKDA